MPGLAHFCSVACTFVWEGIGEGPWVDLTGGGLFEAFLI
jgi:hypothetical protein